MLSNAEKKLVEEWWRECENQLYGREYLLDHDKKDPWQLQVGGQEGLPPSRPRSFKEIVDSGLIIVGIDPLSSSGSRLSNHHDSQCSPTAALKTMTPFLSC
jgi:hypothetical protein